MKYLKIYMSALMAGVCIGFGGTAFLSLDNKVIGSFIFAVGLFAVCTGSLNLFTGKVCYAFDNDNEYKASLILIWIGNLCGTIMLGAGERLTRINSISEKAKEMSAVKTGDSLISLFILGIICNVFIYIAVQGYKCNLHETGKYLSIIFGVMGFILCGSEHCVADMYYFSIAGAWSVNAVICIMVITAGNLVGGIAARELHKFIKIED